MNASDTSSTTSRLQNRSLSSCGLVLPEALRPNFGLAGYAPHQLNSQLQSQKT